MKRRLATGCLAVAAVAAFALVPAATAAHAGPQPVKLKLGLVPLQTEQLGKAGASFALNYGSGPLSNGGGITIITSGSSSGGTEGAVHGYALDYGDPYTGSTGEMEVRSSVERYKTRAGAKIGLRFGGLEDQFLKDILGSPFAPVTEKKLTPPTIGQGGFAYLITRAAPNLNPIVMLDEQVVTGRFVLDLTVTAGSASAAEKAAPRLMFVLHRRLELLLGGHANWTTPKLPRQPKAGQAAGGPDLSTLILQPPDVGQSHAVNLLQSYVAAPPSLSDFLMILDPAGTYGSLVQQIGWWPTATEATYGETYGAGNPFFLLGFGLGGFAQRGTGETVTPVDLSSVDDPATGYLITGFGESEALVEMTNGQAGESIEGASDGTLQASDVLSLAQAAANRLDAGLGP